MLDLSNKEYVVASRAAGRRPAGILLRVILPNALQALLVMAAIDVGRAILSFAILDGFLGLGAQPPQVGMVGAMVSTGATVMDDWWVATFPAMPVLTLASCLQLDRRSDPRRARSLGGWAPPMTRPQATPPSTVGDTLLDVRDLQVARPGQRAAAAAGRARRIVAGPPCGEIFGLLGESGSGQEHDGACHQWPAARRRAGDLRYR